MLGAPAEVPFYRSDEGAIYHKEPVQGDGSFPQQLRGWLLWREKLVKMRTGLTNTIQAYQLTGQVVDLGEITDQMQAQRDELTARLLRT